MVVDFWQIAMRPGKPLLFGRLAPQDGGVPVLGLPGNPVSAMVCSILFLLPALSRLSGLPAAPPPITTALLGKAVGANDHRADHLRATVTTDAGGPAGGDAVPGAGLGDAAPPGAGRRADPAAPRTPRPCRRAPRYR